MDTAVVVIFVLISLSVIFTGIKLIYSIARLAFRITRKMIITVGAILLFPVGLVMKLMKL